MRSSFPSLSRRQALLGAAGLGLSVSFLGGADFSWADEALARRKLVVIVCRGAMDGLSMAPPMGERNYTALRSQIALPGYGQPGGALKLDGDFGLHPKLDAVHKLALAGQARIAPAVATPDRERSHFEGQDVLENGGTAAYGATSGWLNRALQAMAPGRRVSAISVGDGVPLLLRGPLQTASWSPGPAPDGDPRLPTILMDLYAKDPLLGPALASGLQTRTMVEGVMTPDSQMEVGKKSFGKEGPAIALGQAAGRLMTQPNGPSVMALSLYGFDTHHAQGSSEGLLAQRLAVLDGAIDGLHQGLGPAWKDTVVLAVTEFGRTVRVNGTGGTDHGTASAALLAGGALRTGGIVGDWPGLAEARLYEGRDLAPTLDMRGLFKGVLAEHYGIERAALDATVFPDSARVAPVSGIIA
jgi:uncharacterized protein (DUF1501 family)